MRARLIVLAMGFSGILMPLPGGAGEVIVLQPATGARSKRILDDSMEKAKRKQTNKDERMIIVEPPVDSGMSRGAERAQDVMQDAESYLSPGTGVIGSETVKEDGIKIIIRKDPPTGAREARMKARNYLADDETQQNTRKCTVDNQIGSIGEGAGAQQSESASVKSSISFCK